MWRFRFRLALVLVYIVLLAPPTCFGLGQGSQLTEEAPQLTMEFKGGLLTVKLNHAPWPMVLQEIERLIRVRIIVEGQLVGTLTQEFESLPLDEGLRRLFRNTNLVLFYMRGTEEEMVADRLSRVWLFPKEGSAAEQKDTHRSLAKPEDIVPREGEMKSEDEEAADEDQDERFKTLEAFDREGDEDALRKALFDPDEITQKKALELMVARNHQGTIATILDATQSDLPETRLQALHLLHETNYVEEKIVLSALVTALADEDISVKGQAIRVLAHREGPGAMEALRQALRDPAPTVRQLVVGSIVQHDQGLPLLQEALSDVDETVRSLAAWKLGQGVSNEGAGEIERRGEREK